jgi:hypothetical protein
MHFSHRIDLIWSRRGEVSVCASLCLNARRPNVHRPRVLRLNGAARRNVGRKNARRNVEWIPAASKNVAAASRRKPAVRHFEPWERHCGSSRPSPGTLGSSNHGCYVGSYARNRRCWTRNYDRSFPPGGCWTGILCSSRRTMARRRNCQLRGETWAKPAPALVP